VRTLVLDCSGLAFLTTNHFYDGYMMSGHSI
jgi:hypothetical protein